MVNKPKNIGTWTETHTARAFQRCGLDHAGRIPLKGNKDEGDVTLGDEYAWVAVEVKGGHAAETASDAQVAAWLLETEVERVNRGAEIGLLVLKRKGKGAANATDWWVHLPGWAFVKLAQTFPHPHVHQWLPPVRIRLLEAAEMVKQAHSARSDNLG